MLFNEQKLRLYGQLVFGAVLFAFFMLPMLSAPYSYSWMFVRMVVSTVLWVVTIWEPTRYVVLWANKRWNKPSHARRRIFIVASILLPAGIIIAFLRNLLENELVWKLPVHDLTFMLSSIGIHLIFVLAEVALYETIFYFEKWHNSAIEAKELKKLNAEIMLESLKVQIQPHFLFNTLNTLIGLMKMDTERAIRFTEEMARVYRYLLEANERPLISLEEEMKFTEAYFYLLKTRYSEGLHLEIKGHAATGKLMLPPLSLQILVENAVKHNVITTARPLKIEIDVQPEHAELVMLNNVQVKSEVMSNGHGLAHLRKKFNLLNLKEIMIEQSSSVFRVVLPLVKA
jgi:sensor histidine kinase YesM